MNKPIIIDNRALVFGHATEPYNPDKPYIDIGSTTAEDLMYFIYNRPDDYMMPGKRNLTPEDLCKILIERRVTLTPSKHLCLLLLEHLAKQGLLTTNDDSFGHRSS